MYMVHRHFHLGLLNHLSSLDKLYPTLERLLRRKAVQKIRMEVELDRCVSLEEEEKEEDVSFVLQRSVKKLHFGGWSEKEVAAGEVKRMAARDVKTRKLLAGLGVIPALVSMLVSEAAGCRRAAVQALVELGNGTHTNKFLMVEAGVLTKMSNLVTIEDDSSWTHDLVALLHSLSATATAPFFNLTPEILQFLDQVLNSNQTHKTKQACLVTLHHFSTVLDQATTLVSSSNTIHTLISLSTNKEASERALATLGNLIVSVAGKQVVEADHNVPNSFIEVLAWENMPKCQELALYILMILAHGSSIQRAKMARSGIVQVLLGVVLLGSPLAQKRALKILQWFKDEKQRKIGAHSGPQTGRSTGAGLQINGQEIKEGRMVIRKMVKQSLDKNMELIMRRAHVSPDNPKIKSLFQSSSSNSLTY